MEQTRIINILKDHEVFNTLTNEELDEISSIADVLHHGEKEIIYNVEEEETHLYYIVSGEFEVRFNNFRRIQLSQGQLFGEIGMLYPEFRSGSVVALKESTTIRLCRDKLFKENKLKDKTVLKLVTILAKRIIKYLRSTENITSIEMINQGEGEFTEFKSTLRWNLHTDSKDKKIEHAVLKTLAAFLNSKGGVLYIGVKDDGSILGLETDKFENQDKFSLHLTNLIKNYFGAISLKWIHIAFEKIDTKFVCRIDCLPATQPIYLMDQNEDFFYIRTGASTTNLRISKIYAYINERFILSDVMLNEETSN